MKVSYPTIASGIIIIKKNHEKALSLAGLGIFVRHGIMPHIPGPLNQSNLWNFVIQ